MVSTIEIVIDIDVIIVTTMTPRQMVAGEDNFKDLQR